MAMSLLRYVPSYSHINLVNYSDYFYILFLHIIYRASQMLASNICTFLAEMLHSSQKDSRKLAVVVTNIKYLVDIFWGIFRCTQIFFPICFTTKYIVTTLNFSDLRNGSKFRGKQQRMVTRNRHSINDSDG